VISSTYLNPLYLSNNFTQVAIGSSCELYFPLSLSLSFPQSAAHTLLHTHQGPHGYTYSCTPLGLTFYSNYDDVLYWVCHMSWTHQNTMGLGLTWRQPTKQISPFSTMLRPS